MTRSTKPPPRFAGPRPLHYVSAVSLIALSGAFFGACASAPEAPAKMSETAAEPAPEATAAPVAPSPSIGSGNADLGAEERNLELAEKQLSFALQNKTVAGEPLDASTDRCTVVCKALSSMRESAKHVCSLAADRCDSVSQRVKSAEERARGSCPSCAAAG